jgi:group II intron reverse transcriptase/maturase
VSAEEAMATHDKVQELQRTLYRAAKADPGRRFHALYDKVHRRDVLERAWEQVRRNGGAAGIDRATLADVERYGVPRLLDELASALKEETYRPLPARRVYIPKPGQSEKRPLSIPAVRDRIVQAALKTVIEPVFEADFRPASFGFRPKKACHDALQVLLDQSFRGQRWVVETDITNCFGEIPHDRLMSVVEERVCDRKVLKLLRAMLRSGVMEDGSVRHADTGTPQGGVISPLLCNVYLNRLDRAWEDEASGVLVRYADDLVVMCRSRAEAERALERLTALLADLGLQPKPAKTRIVHLVEGGEGFDFLVATRGRTVMSGLADWRVEHVGDSESRVSVRGPVPTLACVAGNGGVRSIRGNAQGRPLHPGATGKGKAGRVNASELSLMPRNRNRRRWDVAPRVGLAAEMRQRRPVTRSRSCEHRRPGVQRAPSPVGSRPCGTWKPPRGPGFGPVSRP